MSKDERLEGFLSSEIVTAPAPVTDAMVIGRGETLLPCPWCASTPLSMPWHGGEPTKVMVACQTDDCPASPQVTGETYSEGIERWNKRAMQAARPVSNSEVMVVLREARDRLFDADYPVSRIDALLAKLEPKETGL